MALDVSCILEVAQSTDSQLFLVCCQDNNNNNKPRHHAKNALSGVGGGYFVDPLTEICISMHCLSLQVSADRVDTNIYI